MSRALASALVRGLIAALLAGCGDGVPPPRGPANVLIYLVDTLRQDHLSTYGYPRKTSPHLDALAADGVRFDNAYSPASWTRPAVASLLSGRYPSDHGAVTRSDRIRPDVRLLAEYLKESGYHTAAFVSNPNVLPIWGFQPGFDDFIDVESVAQSARADRVNEAVLSHLERGRNEPFFLYVHTLDPHEPYDPPAPFDRRWRGRGERSALQAKIDAYDGEISFNDHHFGALMRALDAADLYRDTLIVFVSDHGEEFQDHGRVGHGSTLYEEVVKVPLVVKFPGNAGAGSVVESPVSLLDLLPTVLARAERPPPADAPGIDLEGLVEGRVSTRGRPLFFDLDLLARGRRNVAEAVLLDDLKLLRVLEPVVPDQLFALGSDPGERRNLVSSRSQEHAALADRLSEHRLEASAGVHLWMVNDSGKTVRSCTGELRTTGRFSSLRTGQLEAGDEASLSEDGRRLRFGVSLVNQTDPIRKQAHWVVDSDRLIFTLEPEAAELRVETLRCDGTQVPLRLGAAGRPAGSNPIELGDPSLVVSRMELLFETSRRGSVIAELGGYLGVVARPARVEVEVGPEVEERLRALGYIE